ncbi:DUF742 domain-containing protein [Kitasatospora sp. NBC_01250]|uniref:DUF742 domain-containing protein n=1 Tax=Kitasatospora sp. NBC_01250 TaxID=2903571 RepID=UPI002E2F9E1F|nr:DUF742 domain-containing protein [Kitasatospora sp. NBC_01250]
MPGTVGSGSTGNGGFGPSGPGGVGPGHGRRTDTARPGQGRSSRVRPYAITRGRTRFGRVLLVETLVSALNRPADPADRGLPELTAICDVCRGQMRSIAEISALLHMPLGVVKVLVSDLADQGRIRVHGADVADGTDLAGELPGASKRDLLERVLGGLRKL